MESKLSISKKSEYDRDYDYASDSCQKDDVNDDARLERSLERDMVMQEYENDKDYILQAIKDSLKKRKYEEAQELVFKYRAAAKTDAKFAVLARLTARGLDSNEKIGKIVTVLDATPDDDYKTRAALCKRILKVEPKNETYREELERCQKAMGLVATTTGGAVSTDGDRRMFTQGGIVLASLTIFFTSWFSFAAILDASWGAATVSFVMMAVTSWLYSNHKSSPLKQQSTPVKFLINLLIWFTGVVIFGILL